MIPSQSTASPRVTLPIGIVGVTLGYFWLKKSKVTRGLAVDWLGIIFSTLGFGTILYAFSTVGHNRDGSDDWGSPLILSLLVTGTVSLLIFALVELKFKEPLINLRLFKRPVFALGNVIGWAGMVALFGPNFLLPLYLQGLRQMTPLETGLLILPLAITSGILAPFAGKIFDKIGGRLLMVSGFILLTINTWQLASIERDTDLFYIGVLMAVRGLALGLIIQNTVSVTLSVVEGTELPRASSLTNASRQVAQALGIAVLATLVQGQLNQLGAGGMGNPAAYTTAFMQGLKDAYIFALGLSIIALSLSFFLPGWPGKKVVQMPTPEPLPTSVSRAG